MAKWNAIMLCGFSALGCGSEDVQVPVSGGTGVDAPQSRDSHRTVRARLLDLDGELLDSNRVTFYVAPYSGAPSFRDGQPITVRNGELTLRSDPEGPAPDPGWWVLGDWRDSGCRAVVEIPVPPGSGAGVIDLGELRMVAAPLIAAGRVLDANGDPLEGVPVRAARSLTLTDEAGRFELRGWEPARTQVTAWLPAQPALSVEAATGADALVLQGDAPLVAGRLLLPDGFSQSWLRVNVRRLHADGSSVGSGTVLDDGAFAVFMSSGERESVETHLEVYAHGAAEPLWTEQIPVGAPLRTSLEIDLRHLRKLEVELVDAAGDPVRHAAVQRLAPGASAEQGDSAAVLGVEHTDQQGRVAFTLLGTDRARLLAEVPGYRPAEVEVRAPHARIVLEPGLARHVEVLDLPKLDPGRFRLSVYAVSTGSDQGGFCAADGICSSEGGPLALDLKLPSEGTWSLRWWLHFRPSLDGPWRDHLVQAKTEAFEVTDEVRAFELSAPRAAIEAAVARLTE